MANGYVDGESNMRIAWRIDNGTTDDYTAGLKLATTNGIIVSATLDDNGNNKDVFVTIPDIPNRSCLLYTSPSPRDVEESRMPSSA